MLLRAYCCITMRVLNKHLNIIIVRLCAQKHIFLYVYKIHPYLRQTIAAVRCLRKNISAGKISSSYSSCYFLRASSHSSTWLCVAANRIYWRRNANANTYIHEPRTLKYCITFCVYSGFCFYILFRTFMKMYEWVAARAQLGIILNFFPTLKSFILDNVNIICCRGDWGES